MDREIERIRYVEDHDGLWEGYELKVGADEYVRVMIENGHVCCERWGVREEHPEGLELADFVGETITDIRWGTDGQVGTKDFSGTYEAPVEIWTSAGLLRFVPWNDHEGYYRHLVALEWPGHRDVQEV